MREYSIARFEKALLFLAGMTLPLIELRVELAGFSLSIFMFFLVLLIGLNFKLILNNYRYSVSDMLLFLFSLYMLFTCIYATDIFYALNQWIKLIITISIYGGLKTLFYKKPDYFWIIIKAACIGVSAYLLYLMYHYLYRFGVTYIGVETAYTTKSGKNSLAFMVSFILPFTLYFMINEPVVKKSKLLNAIIVLVTIVGSILIQSRALILLFGFYIVVILYNKKINFKMVKTILVYSIVLLVLANIFAPERMIKDVQTRINSFMYFFEDDYVASGDSSTAGIASLEKRSYLIQKGIGMLKEKPLTGHGIGSFRYYEGISSAVSHNDYVRIIAEQGVIGIIVFLILVSYYTYYAFKIYRFDKNNLNILLAVIGMYAYLFMINAYDNILLWFVMAMIAANKRRLL